MKFSKSLSFFFYSFLFLLLVANLSNASSLINGMSPVNEGYHNFTFFEICTIRIENKFNGNISVRFNNDSFVPVGKVVVPANNTLKKGFRASKWSNIGTVTATAVNAMHIKTDFNIQDNRGVIFSLLPKEFLQDAPKDYDKLDSHTIFTNIPGGEQIFGQEASPFVGNPVFVMRNNELRPLFKGYVPALGDIIEIQVICPTNYPREIIFENRFGGRIYSVDQEYSSKIIGSVLSPVLGVGRFLGTQFVPPGRIRANHTGVIDISTSPLGEFGGFQIIPVNHSMSSEMGRARIKTQWMIIGPLNAEDNSLENVSPFFSSFIRPEYGRNDLNSKNWIAKLQKRFLVQIKINNGEWQPIPAISYKLEEELPAEADTVFEKTTHIRILFPQLSSLTTQSKEQSR
ncbi:MAG: hypothetical protein DKM50_13195 [Candidatus Margulisiibacteriota bacterium]|nr:MAG: hypothetical protein A2X43_13880 [Candidatus Margulisbacteria bacterium GWD2_39_127]OGI05533.1 MAG: hypothetical protein A2X42_00570 [Candidatus Margulisbacteria bacterium GWF2_38_17]OGI08386.1 MAG: hypothetical protein A2X41_10770 [Candidatus Margulisbacteria bacterium GWE2_39_32]PZM77357.1 MAG: hypothetical protein DKM50_13195 [Candidatus Margulisiibacteriota bacterium]HAR63133.1 hypothetical protein [Candidatus Margulisiibacteriota bacterium]